MTPISDERAARLLRLTDGHPGMATMSEIERWEQREIPISQSDLVALIAEREAAGKVREALWALIDKLDALEASPEYNGVWNSYRVHGGRYTGPNYAEELKAARQALKETAQ
jgi:hypothetical protein